MIYRFGNCEIDTERLELRRDGMIRAVEPQVFSLLVHLIENRDHVVSKDALIETVWSGRIVSDATLSSRINAARQAVGDDGRRQALIRTAPRRGFRFVADIEENVSARTTGEAGSKTGLSRDMETDDTVARAMKRPAVAVLPFANLSGDASQEYFSDGLSEDIIMLLSAWRSFPVISRNSSFAFRGQAIDVRQVARELDAGYVIEGSVRRSGGQIRVAAQLVDAETGHQIWAERFDGALHDIFAIQDEITRQIVAAFEPQMERAERNRAAAERAANMSAWDYYLRGRDLLYRVTPHDNAEARVMFEKAIELDPSYSDAWAGLSYSFQRDILLEIVDDRAAWEKEAFEAARRAVVLDNNSSLAHFTLGSAYIWMNDHEASIAETRIALELNPSNTHARLALGNRLDIVGESAEGIPLLEKSLQLHPRDPHSHIYFAQLARAWINAHEYDKALDCLQESVRRNPDHPHTWHVMAICLGHLGRLDEAREAAGKCEALHPGFIARRAHWNIYVDPKANAHLTEGLRKAGLVE